MYLATQHGDKLFLKTEAQAAAKFMTVKLVESIE